MLVFDRRRFRRGFSLVEILVAVLLIGILMAVAAPRLLGARENASDSAAQQQLAQVAAAAEVMYLNSENFSAAEGASLQEAVPDIAIETATAGIVPNTSARQVAAAASGTGDKVWTATALGGDNRCWYIQIRYDNPVGDYFAFTSSSTARTSCALTDAPGTPTAGSTQTGSGQWNAFEFPSGQ